MKYDTDNCTWLNVPFARKDQAKALGAKWDSMTKRWYCPAHTSLFPFEKQGFIGNKSGTKAAQGATPPHTRIGQT